MDTDYEIPVLDEGLARRAVEFLKGEITEKFRDGLKEAYEKDPDGWCHENLWHFRQGMAIRNMLRGVVKDEELPTGNWDDYYVAVVEVAAWIPTKRRVLGGYLDAEA
jgi:hypothetical protein